MSLATIVLPVSLVSIRCVSNVSTEAFDGLPPVLINTSVPLEYLVGKSSLIIPPVADDTDENGINDTDPLVPLLPSKWPAVIC